MDERTEAGVAWRGVDNAKRRGERDERRYGQGLEALTAPQRRSNLNEPQLKTTSFSNNKRLDLDKSELTVTPPRSTDANVNFIKLPQDLARAQIKKVYPVSRNNIPNAKTITKKILKDDDARRLWPTIANKKKLTLNINNPNAESSNNHKQLLSSEADIATDPKITPNRFYLPKMPSKTKNTPDKDKTNSNTFLSRNNFTNKKKSAVCDVNNKNHSKPKKTKINTKSTDSNKPPYVLIKNKFTLCNKTLNQLMGEISDLFQKKNSKI